MLVKAKAYLFARRIICSEVQFVVRVLNGVLELTHSFHPNTMVVFLYIR